jgi:hypothetical protein
MSHAYDPFAALTASIGSQKQAKQQALIALLNSTAAQTVRRVLPRQVIEKHLKYHLQEMQVMMRSFQAVLTFPTDGRKLPQAVLAKMQKQFGADLRNATDKLASEVEELLSKVKLRQVLQSTIMTEVIASTPFPFCLLNDIIYHPKRSRTAHSKQYVPAHVILWASRAPKANVIQVWLELAPHNPEHLKMMSEDELRSEEFLIHVPAGEVYFSAFQTAVAVKLHGLPSEVDATFAGRDHAEMVAEYHRMRELLVRRKGDEGDFLHVLWSRHKEEEEKDAYNFLI